MYVLSIAEAVTVVNAITEDEDRYLSKFMNGVRTAVWADADDFKKWHEG